MVNTVTCRPLGGGEAVEAPASQAALVLAMDFGDALHAASPSRRAIPALTDAAWAYWSLAIAGRLPEGVASLVPGAAAGEVEAAVLGLLGANEVRVVSPGGGEGGEARPTPPTPRR